MNKVVIIGAGQTGRGFIAPIFKDNKFNITFVDKNKKLVKQLQQENQYTIEYFGNVREKRIISGFEAYSIDDQQALEAIANADIVITCVFALNIEQLISVLKEAIKARINGKMTILCCENGVNVKKPLIDANLDAIISEGIIFCTTLKPDETKLDLLSQDYPDMPIDAKVDGLNVHLIRMPLEQDFASLIQRKIYTYNFISAVVAYLGDYLGYQVYGEAANDIIISEFIDKVVPVLSSVIAQKYNIPYDTQLQFSNQAVSKFRNKEIYDTIYRNARGAERKLCINERLLTPLQLAIEYNAQTDPFELVIAAALYYAQEKEGLDAEKTLADMNEFLKDESIVKRISNLFQMFKGKRSLSDIII